MLEKRPSFGGGSTVENLLLNAFLFMLIEQKGKLRHSVNKHLIILTEFPDILTNSSEIQQQIAHRLTFLQILTEFLLSVYRLPKDVL